MLHKPLDIGIELFSELFRFVGEGEAGFLDELDCMRGRAYAVKLIPVEWSRYKLTFLARLVYRDSYSQEVRYVSTGQFSMSCLTDGDTMRLGLIETDDEIVFKRRVAFGSTELASVPLNILKNGVMTLLERLMESNVDTSGYFSKPLPCQYMGNVGDLGQIAQIAAFLNSGATKDLPYPIQIHLNSVNNLECSVVGITGDHIAYRFGVWFHTANSNDVFCYFNMIVGRDGSYSLAVTNDGVSIDVENGACSVLKLECGTYFSWLESRSNERVDFSETGMGVYAREYSKSSDFFGENYDNTLVLTLGSDDIKKLMIDALCESGVIQQ
ncbi:hypothetical protein [Vibrio crassostreae]|uniref:hypothetical protein n=1 Tax=Vibrio crassostreae TaxID=246167 RepID=UPI001B3081D9|nr:hypothetical protein [Vibrio crassostreae]